MKKKSVILLISLFSGLVILVLLLLRGNVQQLVSELAVFCRDPLIILKNQEKIIPSVSAANDYLLSVTKTGTGADKGIVSSSLPGINCGLDCVEWYDSGKQLFLTAFAGNENTFSGWSGDCSSIDGVKCFVTTDKARDVTASFTLKTYTLSISKLGSGFGKIKSDPPGIDCGPNCSKQYGYDTTVSLSASPAVGSTFKGWSGDCTGVGTCTVKMLQARSIKAEFSLKSGTIPLVVTKKGTGTGTITSSPSGISCDANCAASYNSGVFITLTAVPSADSEFSGWSGDCVGKERVCTISLAQARNVIATFNLKKWKLSVAKEGTGKGTITSSPAGIDCFSGTIPGKNPSCSAFFVHNTKITLAATPSPGSTLAGWLGVCRGLTECAFIMDGDKNATAIFTLGFYTLSVSKTGTGQGTVTSNPLGINCDLSNSDCSQPYNYNTQVVLTASPEIGSEFTGWSGACSGNEKICTVSLTENKAVMANFSLKKYALSVSKTGTGQGTVTSNPLGINCGSDCDKKYDYKTAVNLIASPANGSTFTGWSGACSGNKACIVSMTEDRNVTANFTAYTFSVDITASPDSGQTPFQTQLTADVSGTAPGTINYTFWWDCKSSSTSVSETVNICGNPDGIKGNDKGIKFDGINDDPKIVSHNYTVKGPHTVKVIAERNIFAIEKRITVAALTHVPSAKNLKVEQPDYCLFDPSATFSWQFIDPRDGDRQTAYQIQVDNNPSFSSPEIDSGKVLSVSKSYTTPRGLLKYNNTYYWRVKVWDNLDDASAWVGSMMPFSTPIHRYPRIDFKWTPEIPAIGESISFFDNSLVYGGSTKIRWRWDFQDGFPTSFSSKQNPFAIQFHYAGPKTVKLQVTDSDNFSCSASRRIDVKLSIPEWEEKNSSTP